MATQLVRPALPRRPPPMTRWTHALVDEALVRRLDLPPGPG